MIKQIEARYGKLIIDGKVFACEDEEKVLGMLNVKDLKDLQRLPNHVREVLEIWLEDCEEMRSEDADYPDDRWAEAWSHSYSLGPW